MKYFPCISHLALWLGGGGVEGSGGVTKNSLKLSVLGLCVCQCVCVQEENSSEPIVIKEFHPKEGG
jgi:hypothetical protein